MCGISGLFKKNNLHEKEINSFSSISNINLKRRGPDYQDFMIDNENNIILYHSRLSIIDLSDKSNQPSSFNNDRYTITYNGELYNYKEIKDKLLKKKIEFFSSSDTEVVLKSVVNYGLKESLSIFDGMFAFAIFDKNLKTLYLARDKFGQKPIYYYYKDDKFIFSSDIKVISDYLKNDLNFSKDNIAVFLKTSYFPSNDTVYKEINKLQPGHYLKFDFKDNIERHNYWNLKEIIKNKNILSKKSDSYMIDKCEKILCKSVEDTLISDVPVSFYLSSGTDSKLISIIASNILNKKIKTYTLAFENDPNHDESNDVKKLVKYINAEPQYIYIDEDKLKNNIELLCDIYTEPFADSSQLALMTLNKEIKEKVILSGDGGDELFLGYNRHKWLPKIFFYNKIIPNIFLKFIFTLINNISSKKINSKIYSNLFNNFFMYDKANKLFKSLNSKNDFNSYASLITNNFNYSKYEYEVLYDKYYREIWEDNISLIDKICISDSTNYLTDDILVKVDRSCMYYGIENRTPYLNNEVVNFAFNLDKKYKIRKGTQKWILKKILEKHIPTELIYKPKRGFKIPLGNWMIGDLRGFFEDQIKIIKKQEFCNYELFLKYWDDHISLKKNNEDLLFSYFVFSKWLQKNSL